MCHQFSYLSIYLFEFLIKYLIDKSEASHKLLMDTLLSHGLRKDLFAVMSFDSALSMRSDHVGVHARFKEDSPNAVFVYI